MYIFQQSEISWEVRTIHCFEIALAREGAELFEVLFVGFGLDTVHLHHHPFNQPLSFAIYSACREGL